MSRNAHAASSWSEVDGNVEYVVESRATEQRVTWLVVRPSPAYAPRCRQSGMLLTPGCRVVVDAVSLRPVGVLDGRLPPAPLAAGYNPYFDLPAA